MKKNLIKNKQSIGSKIAGLALSLILIFALIRIIILVIYKG